MKNTCAYEQAVTAIINLIILMKNFALIRINQNLSKFHSKLLERLLR